MAEQIEGAAAEAASEPQDEAALPEQAGERSDAPVQPEPAAQGSTDVDSPDPEEAPSPVLERWLGRDDIFNSGIPNRDITEADALAPDLLELAVESGTHERIG